MIMKKVKAALLSLLAVITLLSFSACEKAYLKEVAGTYEMTSISGTVNNIAVHKDDYEYFRIILDTKGRGTIQSKAVGGATYEATGTYTYENGKIRLTTHNGSVKVTEEYDYDAGVITYSMNTDQISFTIALTKVN